MKRYINLLMLFLVCKIFFIGGLNIENECIKIQEEITEYLKEKTLVNILQSSDGHSITYITVITEQNNENTDS